LVQEVPGPEGNVIALYYAELSKKVYALAVELLGAEVWRSAPPNATGSEYLDAFKNTIAGGSSQIRRNVIGERLLGLPAAADVSAKILNDRSPSILSSSSRSSIASSNSSSGRCRLRVRRAPVRADFGLA